jgi:hypothetical protein
MSKAALTPRAVSPLTPGVDRHLASLTAALLQADPHIRDILAFGSAAYAPELARDIDLLVTTANRKRTDLYHEAVAKCPVKVDLLLREPGDPIGPDIATAVCALRHVLHGTDETLKEARQLMPVPTYDHARTYLTVGERDLATAEQERIAMAQDIYNRRAFDALFHAARQASMAFLNTDNTRWGEVRRSLPSPFDARFKRLIDTLHVQYAYDGRYPADRVKEEFRTWRSEVEQFIADLETASAPATPAAPPGVPPPSAP